MNARSKLYVVMGNPTALARARHAGGRFYDAQKHNKLVCGMDIRKQHEEAPFFKAPISLDVIFYMPIPDSVAAKKRPSMKDQWHIIKPDSSNLLKFVEDVATEICYKDDCIIAKISLEKVYDDGKGPRTEFVLMELETPRQHRELV